MTTSQDYTGTVSDEEMRAMLEECGVPSPRYDLLGDKRMYGDGWGFYDTYGKTDQPELERYKVQDIRDYLGF